MFAVRTVLNKRALATSAASSLLLSGITSVGNDENKKFAFCEGNGTGGADEWLEKFKAMGDDLAKTAGGKVQSAVDSGVPTQLSYGFMMGWCSGYAAKKAGKGAAVILGMGFMALQSLSYMGYVQVDHGALKRDIEGLLDLNKDGKIDQEDAQELHAQATKILAYNLPAGGGFSMGFLGGLRSG